MMSAKQKNVCNESRSKINFFKWIVINHYLTDFNQSLNFFRIKLKFQGQRRDNLQLVNTKYKSSFFSFFLQGVSNKY